MLSLFRKKRVDTTQIVDKIEAMVFQWVKQFGFKRYGRTFNRVVDNDIVQVINFQNGCPQKGIYGVLWINIGIRVPECAPLPDEKKIYYQEYDCNIRCRLDEFVDKKDNPYNLKSDPQVIANDIIKKLDEFVLPVFNALSSRKSIIKNLKSFPEINSMRNHLADFDIGLIIQHLSNEN